MATPKKKLKKINNSEQVITQIQQNVEEVLVNHQAQIDKKLDELVSGINIKTINGNSVLGSGNLTVTASGSVSWGGIIGTLSAQTDLQSALNAKQDNLVSGTNIKTINSNSILGSGNLVISAAWGGITGTLSAQTDLQTALDARLTNPMTTNGDLITRSGGSPVRLGIGSTGQVLTVVAGAPVWQDIPQEFTWIDLATNWDSTPTLNKSITGGDVYNYTLNSVTRYRFVPSTYVASQDAFYENFNSMTDVLSDKIVQRGS